MVNRNCFLSKTICPVPYCNTHEKESVLFFYETKHNSILMCLMCVRVWISGSYDMLQDGSSASFCIKTVFPGIYILITIPSCDRIDFIRRLTTKYRDVSKPRYSMLKPENRSFATGGLIDETAVKFHSGRTTLSPHISTLDLGPDSI